MNSINDEYEKLLNYEKNVNDRTIPPGIVSIYLHLEKLKKISSICNVVCEIGVEGIIGSIAILRGLELSLLNNKIYYGYDIVNIQTTRWYDLKDLATKSNINMVFKLGDSIKMSLPNENIDMIFLDGWHVYGQVIRELNYFGPKINKFICFHDTTIDGEFGETIRAGWDAEKQSKDTGIPLEEINKGIWSAITDWLKENSDWIIYRKYEYNNGFTILTKNNIDIIKELDLLKLDN
jgi:hypothetical protein